VFQGIEIDRFVVGRSMLPTPKEDTDPFERQCPDGCLMGLSLLALFLVVNTCPEGMANGFGGPFYERLSQEGGALPAPMDPGIIAAAFCHRRDTSILLQFISGAVAVTLFAERKEEAGGKNSARAWQGGK
jgi:hypothetical protein